MTPTGRLEKSLKALDPDRPIREADIKTSCAGEVRTDILRCSDTRDFAQIGPVRGGAAYWISDCGVYRCIEVGPFGAEWVVGRRSNFVAALPPTMFTDDNAGVELIVQSDTGTHAAKGGFH